ncbi:fumarylacetoacetate hydrolase family protein [Streptomyces mirabilis]|uniref:fumarylacetoacetate hydrolase family protein n=1 Tax=Streptomyces mirabilis TaxID=68239 RepID=UPI0036479A9B
MRIANLRGRLVVRAGDGVIDVAEASEGRFDADPQAVYARWAEFMVWAAKLDPSLARPFDQRLLDAPVPSPRQVFAIGLNYSEHANESRMGLPAEPAVFTKFQTSITGPYAEVSLPTSTVDWEAELVVVIGTQARHVARTDGWSHVAGLTVGQDLSERTRQLVAPLPQFSIGKSFAGFAPIGPELVTLDEVANPDDLELGCSVNDETVQRGRTRDLIFSVPVLIERLSAIVTLLPGDLIFTGTPAGVGHAMEPPRYLSPGDTLRTWIEGVGELSNPLVEGRRHQTAGV